VNDELTKLRSYARRASIALMGLSGGGSEMFERLGDEFYATPELCRDRAQHKAEMRLRHETPDPSHATPSPEAGE
jgi:hypothetical protein